MCFRYYDRVSSVFQPRVIELLYQHGAELTAKTRNGETPFGKSLNPAARSGRRRVGSSDCSARLWIMSAAAAPGSLSCATDARRLRVRLSGEVRLRAQSGAVLTASRISSQLN